MALPYNRKLTEEVITKIAAAVGIGVRPEVAARALGVPHSTYYDWMKRGRAPGPGDHLYVQLVEEIEKAKGVAQTLLIRDMRNLAQRDFRAAEFMLKRMEAPTVATPGAAASGPTIHVTIERKEPQHGTRPVDQAPERGDDLADPEGERDPVGAGLVERGLGEPEPGGEVVITVQGRAVA